MGWFDGVGDEVSSWFDSGDSIGVDPNFYDSPIGPEMGPLDVDPNFYDSPIGPEFDPNANLYDHPIGPNLNGSNFEGGDNSGNYDKPIGPTPSGGTDAGASRSQSPFWQNAAKLVGGAAAGFAKGSTAGAAGSTNILNAAMPKLNPMPTTGPQAMSRGSGPAATVGGTDAIAAWTRLFSGNH